jgi:hypothetical protein
MLGGCKGQTKILSAVVSWCRLTENKKNKKTLDKSKNK